MREKLRDYETEGLRREEILDLMFLDFDCYAWSIRTLDRRLRYFDIRCTDADVSVDEVEESGNARDGWSRQATWVQSNAEKSEANS